MVKNKIAPEVNPKDDYLKKLDKDLRDKNLYTYWFFSTLKRI